MAEWSNAAVLKTVEPLRVPGVQIPLAPLFWKRGRAVIQRIANPSVPLGLGRFDSCRFRLPKRKAF